MGRAARDHGYRTFLLNELWQRPWLRSRTTETLYGNTAPALPRPCKRSTA